MLHDPSHDRISIQPGWNTVLVVGVALVAAAIRFWNFPSLGYSHWDEFYFIGDALAVGREWPAGIWSIGWVETPLVAYTDGTLFHFLGGETVIPLVVSALYGTASVIALYFLGSRLFGQGVGLIAAAIFATAKFSVMFSRMALADSTFEFWLICSVLFIWLGFTRKSIGYYVLGGISVGFCLNAKYDGLFPMVLAIAWLAGELVFDLIRSRRPFQSLAAEYRARMLGTGMLIYLALVLFLPFLVKIGTQPGFGVVLATHGTYFENTLVETTPKILAWYLWLWTSPLTLLLAGAGIAVAVIRFTRADRLLLLYVAGWFLALMLFAPYPREALSLVPAAAILAGRAIVEAWNLITASGRRPPWVATAAAAACIAAVLFGQVVPLPHMLSLRTQGYVDAGALAARYQAGGARIWTRTQAVASLYLHDQNFLDATPTSVRLLNEETTNVVFMTDQTLGWYPRLSELFPLNRDRLQVTDRVLNPMYDEVLLQPATEDQLARLDNPPDPYRYITFWRVTGPLLFPSDWPSKA